MIESKDCPICGGQIMFEYVRPDFFFYIEEGKIKRDTNHDLWEGTDPYLRFRCTNDITHELELDPKSGLPDMILKGWMEEVEEKFFREKLYDI